MLNRWPLFVFAAIMAAIPLIPAMPPFWILLLDNIGLAALVAMGLVLLTGVGGLTSFGQAAFCGFGGYTTALLTTGYRGGPPADPARLAHRRRHCRRHPRHHRGAAVRPLFAARHHRLGHRPLLSLQQARIH